jgi:hypothetical protein
MLQLRRGAAASHCPLGFEPEDHHLPGLRPQDLVGMRQGMSRSLLNYVGPMLPE